MDGIPTVTIFPISTKTYTNHKAQVLGYIRFYYVLEFLKLLRQYTYDYRLWRGSNLFYQCCLAIGSPFIMVPLSLVAMKNIDNHNTADASTLTNVMRNLGGAFSIAIIATLLDNKTREHLSHIKESLPYVSTKAWDALREQQSYFMQMGSDTVTSIQQAETVLLNTMQRDAAIMAYNDVFLIMSIFLAIAAALILSMKD